jgi:hypothetical protein
MNFQISGLEPSAFEHLFGLDDESLSGLGVQRMEVDEHPGFPCRISLEDAQVGETVLLLNFEHQPADSPYRSCHAIFVSESASKAAPEVNQVPLSLKRRLLSVRAFDNEGMMLDAEVVEGAALDEVIAKLFADEACSYLHVHNAGRGCYAARVDRA